MAALTIRELPARLLADVAQAPPTNYRHQSSNNFDQLFVICYRRRREVGVSLVGRVTE